MEQSDFELTCLTCGAKIIIPPGFVPFITCSQCKTEFVVNRAIGVISLVPFSKHQRSAMDYVGEGNEAEIQKLEGEIKDIRVRIEKQNDWIRNRQPTERSWLQGFFTAWRVRSAQRGESQPEKGEDDQLGELNHLTIQQTEELIKHLTHLSWSYPNDRRIKNLVSVFQNIKNLLDSIEQKEKLIEEKKNPPVSDYEPPQWIL
jgi:hypothetical protein